LKTLSSQKSTHVTAIGATYATAKFDYATARTTAAAAVSEPDIDLQNRVIFSFKRSLFHRKSAGRPEPERSSF
jgi:hypothetical protein